MSPLRETAALLVAIMILTSVAAGPLPEETNNEVDNIIPQKSDPITQKTTTQQVTSSPAPNKVHITRAPPIATSPNGFSKFINDVFQIPISVLKAVSSFLSNTFGNGQKS
ncbi:uncharacterized protein LOC117282824 [Cryptotermes secundus]|uniref:uncharacterized protein LOC117282824 n=1 Tax=Cryptotermes secundus TaxID=105785 RepID=UPI001454C66C|nr:uncharacterized protein LOC117282824 [Cryptotermes secundus]